MKRTMCGKTLIHWDISSKEKIAGTFRLRTKIRGHIVKDIIKRTLLPVFRSTSNKSLEYNHSANNDCRDLLLFLHI